MLELVYVLITAVVGLFDHFAREASFYTVVNVCLRVLVLLPLLFGVARGTSRYARLFRTTLWLVLLADVLLPLVFEAGMLTFLVVHLLNVVNFAKEVERRHSWLPGLVGPLLGTFALAVILYGTFLYPAMDGFFRVIVGVYLVPITLAWSLSITAWIQHRTAWSLQVAAGMSLFFLTDFQVAAQLLAHLDIPLYGLVNAVTY